MLSIEYKSKKLRRQCLEFEKAKATWGERQARLVQQRINEFLAVNSMADLSHLPPTRCHLLKGRKSEYSVNLVHPFRLIFEPIGERSEIYEGNTLLREKVTTIRILRVEDTH